MRIQSPPQEREGVMSAEQYRFYAIGHYERIQRIAEIGKIVGQVIAGIGIIAAACFYGSPALPVIAGILLTVCVAVVLFFLFMIVSSASGSSPGGKGGVIGDCSGCCAPLAFFFCDAPKEMAHCIYGNPSLLIKSAIAFGSIVGSGLTIGIAGMLVSNWCEHKIAALKAASDEDLQAWQQQNEDEESIRPEGAPPPSESLSPGENRLPEGVAIDQSPGYRPMVSPKVRRVGETGFSQFIEKTPDRSPAKAGLPGVGSPQLLDLNDEPGSQGAPLPEEKKVVVAADVEGEKQ